MDRRLYPSDWTTIALVKKAEADWICEECGKPCRQYQESREDFKKRLLSLDNWRWGEELVPKRWVTKDGVPQVVFDPPRWGRFVLTVSHTNHDPWNPDAELRALCAPCHCRYDLSPAQRFRKSFAKREYYGQLNLLEEA